MIQVVNFLVNRSLIESWAIPFSSTPSDSIDKSPDRCSEDFSLVWTSASFVRVLTR